MSATDDRAAKERATDHLEAAYSLETPEDSIQLYASWADSYDETFIEATGYVYHEGLVGAFLDAGGSAGGAVLDVGCGTGVVGIELGDQGETTVDGLDISPEMLAVAATKITAHGMKAYRNLLEVDLTGPVDLPADSYTGIVSAGTFTFGHLPPSGIDPLLRLGAPSAVCAIGVNAEHFTEQGFERYFADRAAEGAITVPELVDIPIYGAFESEHGGTRATVAVFQILR